MVVKEVDHLAEVTELGWSRDQTPLPPQDGPGEYLSEDDPFVRALRYKIPIYHGRITEHWTEAHDTFEPHAKVLIEHEGEDLLVAEGRVETHMGHGDQIIDPTGRAVAEQGR